MCYGHTTVHIVKAILNMAYIENFHSFSKRFHTNDINYIHVKVDIFGFRRQKYMGSPIVSS